MCVLHQIFISFFWTFLGAMLGFGISLLGIYFNKQRKEKFYSNYFKDYVGCYKSERKDPNSINQLKSITFIWIKSRNLKIDIETEKNGKAVGSIIMNKDNLNIGSGFYYHENKENLSGYYDVILISPGIIHIMQNYIKGSDGSTVKLLYILKKEEI